jgi:hypothetical protein
VFLWGQATQAIQAIQARLVPLWDQEAIQARSVPLWDQEAIQARSVPLWDQEARQVLVSGQDATQARQVLVSGQDVSCPPRARTSNRTRILELTKLRWPWAVLAADRCVRVVLKKGSSDPGFEGNHESDLDKRGFSSGTGTRFAPREDIKLNPNISSQRYRDGPEPFSVRDGHRAASQTVQLTQLAQTVRLTLNVRSRAPQISFKRQKRRLTTSRDPGEAGP